MRTLQRRAEVRLQKSAPRASTLPEDDAQRLLQEIQVHQTEMEMQNEELRRIRNAFETARDRFKALYDLAPTGYLTLDPEGVVGEANLTAATILGIERKDLVGRKLVRFILPEDRDIFYLHQQETYLAWDKKTCELHILRPDGKPAPIQLESIAMHDKKDFRQECLVAMRDITERRQMETERVRLAAIVESSSDAIISRSLDNIITSWNKGAEDMLGHTAQEALGRNYDILLPPERRNESDYVLQAIREEKKLESFESERVAKNGRRILVSTTISPIKDPNGRIVGISSIVRDITQQKKAEEAIQRSERNLADFFSESPLGLIWVEPDGRVLRANQAQLELLDSSTDQITGRHIMGFFTDPELAADLLERLTKKETLRNYQVRLRSAIGALKHVLIDANGLWERGQLVYSRWFVRDITRRKELEREILAISEREQRRIGQDLHDDLGQQLTGIEYLAQTLAGQLTPISKAASNRAGEIARMVQRATSHTRELAHGLSPIGLEADGLMIALRQLAARTKQVFRIDCRFRCSPAVYIHDPEVGVHLYRIAQEAVSNAIKHGKARRIDIGLVLNGERVVLAVSDNGIGMPKRPRKRKGMGLRVMQYRAGVIGGSLVVQRQPDGGTTFVCVVKGVHAIPKKNK